MDTVIANLIDLFAVLMLLMSIMAIATTRMKPLISMFTLQSLFLAILAGIVAYAYDTPHIYTMCVLTLVIKVLVMPKMMYYIMSKINVGKELELNIGIPGSLLLSAAMMIIAYYITEPLLISYGSVERNCLALSMSIILIGLLTMCTRKKAITETIGLLMIENGLFLGALALSHGMPLIVELGAFFDVIVSLILIGIFANRINKSFDSVDTSFLRRLKE